MRRLGSIALASCTALLLAACTTVLQGKPVSIFDDPFRVAGMPAVNGDTGLRPGAPAPSRAAIGSDGGGVDGLARSAMSDVEDFWSSAYGQTFPGRFTPVQRWYSWDADGDDTQFCGAETFGTVNAGYCFADDTVGWDRGVLLPSLREAYGDMAIAMVLAHEYGHAIQHRAHLTDDHTLTLVAEQQADCLAGTYLRWVAEGHSARFALSTSDGLNNLLAAMISFRDPLLRAGESPAGQDPHGSAFERVSAFQLGFTDGAASCAGIDEQEIARRRGDLPDSLQRNDTGELDITEQSVRDVVDAVADVFRNARRPDVDFDAARGCPDSRDRGPARYCPARDAIVVDLPALRALGAPSAAGERGLAKGDDTAISVLISRYAMAVQHQRGLALDDAVAALRTACLTGVATARMATASTIGSTAGDLDEAVSGLLANGEAASDVNGDTVPSGFSRIDAFRIGVLGDQDRCQRRFP